MQIQKLIIVALFLFSVTVSAQTLSNNSVNNFAEIKQTTKFGEFGDIGEKEFAPKLKDFSAILRKNNLQGVVVFYNSFNGTPFQKTKYFAERKTQTYSKYFNSGYEPSRITFVLGGLREKMTTELWFVPSEEQLPQIVNSGELAKDERYRLEKLETGQVYFARAKREPENAENDETDDEKIIDYREDADFAKDLTDILSRDKTWRAVLIFYADADDYDTEMIKELIENQLQQYAKSSKLDLNQVKIIYGGYRLLPELETWIINKNGIEPEAMPDEKIEEN